MKILSFISALLLIATLAVCGWILQKKLSYSFSYENMVKETICEMVKPEYLKQPCGGMI